MRAWLVAVLAATGCDNGSFDDCAVACTAATGCPDGFTCGREGMCRLEGATQACTEVMVCRPGAQRACYTGADGTKGVGPCKGGQQLCDGTGHWGACEGEVVPIGESCGDLVDNNCNGDVDELADVDGDGFTTCGTSGIGSDCCDTTAECATPALVNPGAFEIAGNGIDDDCNRAVDDTAPCDTGLASGSTSALDFARAMELCRVTTAGAKTWGVLDGTISLTTGSGVPDKEGHAIRPKLGGAMPLAGGAMAVLSTGGAAGKLDTNPAYHGWSYVHVSGATSSFPSDWLLANGNQLPRAPGCPAISGTSAFDPVMLTYHIRVPTNARSFELRSNLFSADFPEWVCSPYNDFFVVLLDSRYAGAPANPGDKNLAFHLPAGATVKTPIGVNLARIDDMFTQCLDGRTGCASGAIPGTIDTCTGTGMLASTGLEDALANQCDATSIVGGATGWLVTRGNVVPGETITLRIAVWDTTDGTIDSTVLLDGFAWSTEPAQPGTVRN